MEPLDTAVFSGPEIRLKVLKRSLGVKDSAEGLFTRVTTDNVIDLLIQHKGHEDVRINTYAKNEDILGLLLNVDDIIMLMADGNEVYQYIIKYTPSWIRNRRQEGPEDIPPTWIKADQVAEIKKAETRTVNEHCRKGNLTCQRFAEGDYYINPDLKLDYWIKSLPDYGALYQRLLLIQDVLDASDPGDVNEMFDSARELESQIDVRIRGSKSRVLFENFVINSLGKLAPKNVMEWRRKIRALVITIGIKRKELYSTGREPKN